MENSNNKASNKWFVWQEKRLRERETEKDREREGEREQGSARIVMDTGRS